jgi:molybdopterin-guanine dinucleotide biosynthesis protein A
MQTETKVVGLILAGGQSSRMQGHDKSTLLLHGQSMMAHVVERLLPQVAAVWISSNNIAAHQRFGIPVFNDAPALVGKGPLAGLVSFADVVPSDATHIQLLPCDTPFIPRDLTQRLLTQSLRHQASVYPCSDGRAHYACALLRLEDLSIAQQCALRDERSLKNWLTRAGAQAVDGFISDDFLNINTPEQLSAANFNEPS